MVAPDLPIGDRVRHHRGTRRQDVVAGLVGITPDYLSQIERNLKIPTIAVLHDIARELGVPTAALLSERAEPLAAGPRDDRTGHHSGADGLRIATQRCTYGDACAAGAGGGGLALLADLPDPVH